MTAQPKIVPEVPQILVVEDDSDLRKILRAILMREGYSVLTAGDGEEGLEVVEAHHPDLILLDVMMPKMDGRELCRRLKANVRTSQIPIIMLTAMSETNDRIGGLDLGANDYVTKPYEQRELLMRVRNLLDWGRLQRDANPLTGLPGNKGIEQQLRLRLENGGDFVFMYLDVDHFKPFNDFYSYQKGDQIIRLLAFLLRQAVDDLGAPTDFVGHVGGDDFVVITQPDRAQQVGDWIIQRFDEQVPELYNEVDRERGYIETKNRQGLVQRYPIMTLTIAAVSTANQGASHVAEISDIAAELKRFGKSQNRSVLVWDRRADG
ncbi:MAG: response regulator [Candidatus Eisenbacteria bacterium]|uniref:Response regulator n=1 Tax=Eiseniibacteriota bacterium TaxID=2212470 RepID=A0A956NBW5_UNCEI|nr:response regulator [Candidatus Eisenbacteria bacterium]MCB9463759.1 response regulator [Candidatus Eisenbacteria bacterium]